MPDANGQLLATERQFIADMMKTRLKPAACPWCESSQWEVGPFITVSPALRPNGTMAAGGPTVPMVALISPCGYAAYFAAKKFGLEVRPPEAASPSDTPTPAPAAG